MPRIVFLICAWVAFISAAQAQEYFTIQNFDVAVNVNQDGSLNINEKIAVHFTKPRHGIFRSIPYRYRLTDLPDSVQKSTSGWTYNGHRYTKIKNIQVKDFNWEKTIEDDYITLRIGSENKTVNGDQLYEISYTVLGAINFFSDHSELYLNLTGNGWPVSIIQSHFNIHLYAPLKVEPEWFVASGPKGSKENNTNTLWVNNSTWEGSLTNALQPYEGITAGIRMPAGFLTEPAYKTMGIGWLAVPVAVFVFMFWLWRKYGKDLPVTVTTQFYPPDNINPSVAGYIIDGKSDRRDLTALIPYWGAGGYLKVEETETKKFLGLVKDYEYKFIKIKELPATAETFEKTMFDGLFSGRTEVILSDLKDKFYSTMNKAKRDLENEIVESRYYEKNTRGAAIGLVILGVIGFILSGFFFVFSYPFDVFLWGGLMVSALSILIFGVLMGKKTRKGTELYQQLLGFKEFIKTVEKDRLREFLKQDENYFDKVLPFAIVFDVADTWKDKLRGLDVPLPSWYSGYYSGNTFNTMAFLSSLDRGMNSMSRNFYSSPSSSGSGGSFGGGGSSGGGFGGGGGGSW